jgi:hypothetical protein
LLGLVMVCGVGLSACGGGGASVASFCSLVRKDDTELRNIGSNQADLTKAAGAVKSLVGKAPSDIKPDVQTLADAFSQLAKGNTAAVQANATKLNAAADHLKTYAKDKCNVTLATG